MDFRKRSWRDLDLSGRDGKSNADESNSRILIAFCAASLQSSMSVLSLCC